MRDRAGEGQKGTRQTRNRKRARLGPREATHHAQRATLTSGSQHRTTGVTPAAGRTAAGRPGSSSPGRLTIPTPPQQSNATGSPFMKRTTLSLTLFLSGLMFISLVAAPAQA